MKVAIDSSACVGCGLCESNCPNVFKLGDDGVVRVKQFTDPGCDLKEVAEQCPVNCITIEG